MTIDSLLRQGIMLGLVAMLSGCDTKKPMPPSCDCPSNICLYIDGSLEAELKTPSPQQMKEIDIIRVGYFGQEFDNLLLKSGAKTYVDEDFSSERGCFSTGIVAKGKYISEKIDNDCSFYPMINAVTQEWVVSIDVLAGATPKQFVLVSSSYRSAGVKWGITDKGYLDDGAGNTVYFKSGKPDPSQDHTVTMCHSPPKSVDLRTSSLPSDWTPTVYRSQGEQTSCTLSYSLKDYKGIIQEDELPNVKIGLAHDVTGEDYTSPFVNFVETAAGERIPLDTILVIHPQQNSVYTLDTKQGILQNVIIPDFTFVGTKHPRRPNWKSIPVTVVYGDMRISCKPITSAKKQTPPSTSYSGLEEATPCTLKYSEKNPWDQKVVAKKLPNLKVELGASLVDFIETTNGERYPLTSLRLVEPLGNSIYTVGTLETTLHNVPLRDFHFAGWYQNSGRTLPWTNVVGEVRFECNR